MRNVYILSALLIFLSGNIFGQAPSTQATSLAINNLSQTEFDISWVRGDGGNCIVMAFEGSLSLPTVVDGTTYTADVNFADGSECGTGWYCVYNGTGTSVTLTGLTANTHYIIYVYEYNGASGSEEYLATLGASNQANSYTLPSVFDVTGGGSYCEGISPTDVDVSLSGSETGVTYQLFKGGVAEGSPVNGTASALLWEDLSAGTYTVEASNIDGTETMNGNAVVTENSLPIVSASSNSPVCEDLSLTLTGGPGGMATYAWTGPDSYSDNTQSPTVSSSATNAMAGTYTLVVTDGNGCTNSGTTDVTVNSLPSATASSNSPACEGSSLTLTGGPGGMATYAWTGPDSYSDNTQNPTVSSSATNAMAGTYTLVVTDGNGCANSATASVIVYSVPSVTATNNSPVCEGSSLILIGNSGAVTSYAWSGPNGYTSTTQISTVSFSATVAMAGIYTLVVTDVNGCTESATSSVTVNAMPVVNTSSNSPVCEVSSLMLTGNPGTMTTYAWSGPNSYSNATQSPTVSSSATTDMTGIYTLVVTDNNGCTNSSSTYVAVVALPIATATSNSPVCEGSPLELTGGPYVMASYVWSGPDSFTNSIQSPTVSSSSTVAMAGTYTLIVTDGSGCTSSATTDVVVNTVIAVSFTGLAEGYCIDANSTTLVPTPTGGTFTGAGIISDYFDPSDAGAGIFEITYTYTDTNGCTNISKDTTEVYALPAIPLDTVTRVCDTIAILDAGSGHASYLWSNGSTAQTLTVSVNGTYRVTVTDIHGCTNNVSTHLTLDSALILVVSDTVNSCRGSNTTLTATGTAGSTFIWNDSITSASILVSPTTEQYYYIVMTNGLCMAEDSVLVIPHDPPVVTLPDTITNCGKIILDPGSGPGTYIWTGWATTPTLLVLTSGIYRVTVTNSDGCSATGTSNVTILPPVVYLGSDITLALNQTVVLGTSPGFDTYLWSTGETSYSITITGSDLGIGIHEIWLRADLSNGCSDTDTININVTWASDVEENSSGNNITIYPNPASDAIFVITENGNTIDEILLYNMLGEILSTELRTNFIDVSSVPSGIYSLIIKSGNSMPIKKTIVIKK